MIWSLRNHPEEWSFDNRSHYTIVHGPSNHEFWIVNGWGFYGLYSADCGCSRTRTTFSWLQQGKFGRAFKAWRRWSYRKAAGNGVQFAAHFVH